MVKKILKIAALRLLAGLHRAVFAFQKNALAFRFFHWRQTAPVLAQPRERLDEFMFTYAFEGARRAISAFVKRTWPSQRSQVVQR